MCAPSPPPAPDYTAAANAQGAANVEAARTQGRINNPNYYGPTGSQVVTWDGDTPTVRQTLNPLENDIYTMGAYNRRGLQGLANQGINSLTGVIGRPVDFSGAAPYGTVFQEKTGGAVLDPSTLSAMPSVYRRGALPDMPGSAEATRQRVIDAMMSRADSDFSNRAAQKRSELIAAGITPGTEAYQREMDILERSRNDARNQAEIAGGNAADQAFQEDLARRQQGYNEGTTDSSLAYSQGMGIRGQQVAEQAQRFGQQGQNEELRMREQAQSSSQQNDLRRQMIAEYLAQRQIPMNEISALMSGSQVQNPFAIGGFNGNTTVAPAPIFGATSAADQANMARYGMNVGTANNLMSGLFGLGSAGIRGFFS